MTMNKQERTSAVTFKRNNKNESNIFLLG